MKKHTDQMTGMVTPGSFQSGVIFSPVQKTSKEKNPPVKQSDTLQISLPHATKTFKNIGNLFHGGSKAINVTPTYLNQSATSQSKSQSNVAE